MDKKHVLEIIKKVKAESQKRNFKQSYDLIISLRDLDLKKQDQQVDQYITLTHDSGRKIKICGLVAEELEGKSKEAFDTTITQSEFKKVAADKKRMRKLSQDHKYFVAQANIMADVATSFGRILGPKGKMPNPKAGCVVPPTLTDLKPIYNKLQKTVRLRANTQLHLQAIIGKEDMPDEKIAENIVNLYAQLVHALPREENNVEKVFLKLSMGKPVRLDERKK